MLKTFIQYSTAGGIATVFHYICFIIAVKSLLWQPWQATLLGASIGAFVSYVLNYQFTFAVQIKDNAEAKHTLLLPKFLMVASIGVIIQTLIVAGLSHCQQVNYLIAQIIATIIGLILTFLINRFWTFA